MIKIREFKESNYRGVWFNGKTIRIALDPAKPITELEYPEFYDIKLTDWCSGCCIFCYMDSTREGAHFSDVIGKVQRFFGPMSKNQRPFQVALGGGEPTSHPEFLKILKVFHELDIEPNYTTNGMWTNGDKGKITEDEIELLSTTLKYCGGVAVSCHPHLKPYWKRAASLYHSYKIKLNFHLIISDRKSIDDFVEIYKEWNDKVDHFVLLPYGNQGRAEHKDIDWEYLVSNLPEDQSKLAFGANFYPYLLKGNHCIKVSLYEPELMSKFLDLKNMKLYPSSFCTDTPLN